MVQKQQKKRIRSKNNNDKYFQYTLTVALYYQNTKNNPERLTKIKPFIENYN